MPTATLNQVAVNTLKFTRNTKIHCPVKTAKRNTER